MTLCLGRGHSIRSTSIFCANIRFLRWLNLSATLMERIPVKVFDEFAAEGTRMTYGGMRPVSRPVRGGLAPWQERRAKEILRANLHGVPLKKVARECGLSVGY